MLWKLAAVVGGAATLGMLAFIAIQVSEINETLGFMSQDADAISRDTSDILKTLER